MKMPKDFEKFAKMSKISWKEKKRTFRGKRGHVVKSAMPNLVNPI